MTHDFSAKAVVRQGYKRAYKYCLNCRKAVVGRFKVDSECFGKGGKPTSQETE